MSAAQEPDPALVADVEAAIKGDGPATMPLYHVDVPIADLIREMAAHPDIVAMAVPARPLRMSTQDIYRAWSAHPGCGNGALLYMPGEPRHAAGPWLCRWRAVVRAARAGAEVARWVWVILCGVAAGLVTAYVVLLFVAALGESGHPVAAHALAWSVFVGAIVVGVVAWRYHRAVRAGGGR